MRHVDWSIVKCLVIAGPGFTKDEFRSFLDAEAVRRDDRALLLNKTRVVLAPASSAFKHCLKEVLALPAVAAQIKVRRDARTSNAVASAMWRRTFPVYTMSRYGWWLHAPPGHQGGARDGGAAGISYHDGNRASKSVLRPRPRQGCPSSWRHPGLYTGWCCVRLDRAQPHRRC